ncbi:PP2C family protein-serine/threonine phosphatase [Oleispirillum naphthae]|uniref:PP2C family protein-serine/threonine phosphatase n=1 Tax=Oleispirillum naphthae TaxID=2838853 RepID=UPI0030825147
MNEDGDSRGGLQARLRRVPIRRRIFYTLILYTLAVAVMVVAGWQVSLLTRDYRQDSAALREQTRKATAMRHAINTLGVLGDSFLRSGDTSQIAQFNVMAGEVERTLDPFIGRTETLDLEPSRLHLSFEGYLQAFGKVTALSMSAHELYTGYLSSSEDLMQQRLLRLAEQPDLPPGIHENLLQARFEFAKARTAILAFMNSREGLGAVQAVAALRRVGECLQLAVLLDERSGFSEDFRGAQRALRGMMMETARIKTLVDRRTQTANGFLSLYRIGMNRSADHLVEMVSAREGALQDSLKRDMNITLAITGAGVLLLLLVGLAAGGLIARSIRDPLLRLNALMREVSEGNWERDIAADDGQDEIAEMTRTLAGFKRNALTLREMEVEKQVMLIREKEETEQALHSLDQAHHEIQILNDRLNEENLRLGTELDVSRRLQRMLLPRPEELAEVAPLDIAAFMEPATEVGGDYYDVLADGDGVCIGIGDVTGHGLESGVVMLLAQSAVRTLVTAEEHDLPRLLDVLNRAMYQNIRRLGCEKNLSFALLDYRPRGAGEEDLPAGVAGRLHIVGQHESVLILRCSGTIEELDTLELGLPLGLVDRIGAYTGVAAADLFPGDLVVLYSDGITEAADANGLLFGVARLKEELLRHAPAEVSAIKDAVIAAVRAHIGDAPVYDDMTLLVIRQR